MWVYCEQTKNILCKFNVKYDVVASNKNFKRSSWCEKKPILLDIFDKVCLPATSGV